MPPGEGGEAALMAPWKAGTLLPLSLLALCGGHHLLANQQVLSILGPAREPRPLHLSVPGPGPAVCVGDPCTPAPLGLGRPCVSATPAPLGILLVYDITNRWSFDGIDRWIKEIDEHAPGVPRILVGNRLHLAFKRQVPTEQARAYAEKNCMTFFEVSPLCNFNVIESFTELSRIVLMRHGMEKIWRPNRVFSLQDLCCRAIVSCTPVHLIDKLPLPVTIKSHLKSFSMANGMNAVMMHGRSYSLASGAGSGGSKGNSLKRSKSIRPPQSPPQNCSRSNCKIS
ncbi:Ras- protein Rab-40C [Saguinus oedipus]|uniref:small monomeric GTPase n=1 Tax=Saguinus oedipus TaxID=9490 RepID=A0ABQ9UJC2_SAGOE|nr:Ras- protein Rab-40C [Saguinus oedipus]